MQGGAGGRYFFVGNTFSKAINGYALGLYVATIDEVVVGTIAYLKEVYIQE